MKIRSDELTGYSRIYLDTGLILGPGIDASDMAGSLQKWEHHIPSLTSLITDLGKEGIEIRIVPESLVELRRGFVRNYHRHNDKGPRKIHPRGDAGKSYIMLWEFYILLEGFKESAPRNPELYGPIRQFSREQSMIHNPEPKKKIKADEVILAHFLYSTLVERNPTCLLTTDHKLRNVSISAYNVSRNMHLPGTNGHSTATGVVYFDNKGQPYHTKIR